MSKPKVLIVTNTRDKDIFEFVINDTTVIKISATELAKLLMNKNKTAH